ncbi:TIGR03621 family F420-dependent LLM class oxidoreductase [Ilumatobacter nonamiensis]|uniref:TIGR03621 family F420-dependent LLM class oxidoreductase n=1 Tax=Ilumatobacter nonamiensis TaxID=467093 RepID=UPI000347E238|nr:TIGR03621 family F420-dependent LLM class oxidoreductase [Ilumatobacter nonamiensis]
MTRAIRFGHQFRSTGDAAPIEAAQRAEAAGFDTFLLPDHVGGGFSPMVALAAAAVGTSSIRLGTFVLNADMRNPVQLAWEATTLDQASNGRFELGLGAGHTPHEYAATGIPLETPRVRKEALAERVEIIRRLVDGDTVTIDGTHHHLVDASIQRGRQPRMPILVGGNGAALLAHAGAHADIIGLQGLGRTGPDGHTHEVRWTSDHLDDQLDQVRAGAGVRVGEIELNALVQVVEVTDDAERSLTAMAGEMGDGVGPDDLAQVPYVLVGTVEEIAEKILHCRDRWGITYFAVRALDEFVPVIERVRRLEA